MNYNDDFQFNPTKFYCKKHRYEVEFCCEITNEFYCRKCKPDHIDCMGDKVLSSIPYQLQQQLVALKMVYSKKKEALVGKLDRH